MIAILGLIITLLALYEVMLLVQVQTGVKGLVLSLLPSFPTICTIGWCLKRRCLKRRSQKKKEKCDGSETLQLMEEEQLSEDIKLLLV